MFGLRLLVCFNFFSLLLRLPLPARVMCVAAAVLGVCPGLHVCLILWGELSLVPACLCVIDAIGLLTLALGPTLSPDWSEAERLPTLSLVSVILSLVGAASWDLSHWVVAPHHISLISLPALHLSALSFLVLTLALRNLPEEQGHLPTSAAAPSDPVTPRQGLLANFAVVLATLLAATQRPIDPVLGDLWCCACCLLLGLLSCDHIFIKNLLGSKRAAPPLSAVAAFLFCVSSYRAIIGKGDGILGVMAFILESALILTTIPGFVCLWESLWKEQHCWEAAVVFLMPWPLLLVSVGGHWLLTAASIATSTWLMNYRLPMIPYSDADFDK